MKRLFPTQLRVVSSKDELVAEEEARKNYYDASSSHSLFIGANAERRVIYMSSPRNWYRSYAFHIYDKLQKPSPEKGKEEDDDDDDEYNGDADVNDANADQHEDEGRMVGRYGLKRRDENDVWRIISLLMKTECGRKVIHDGKSRHLEVYGVNADMAKQIYYLLKHLLTRLGFDYKLTSAYVLSPWRYATMPNVREKPKRQRRRKRNSDGGGGGATHTNFWKTVA